MDPVAERKILTSILDILCWPLHENQRSQTPVFSVMFHESFSRQRPPFQEMKFPMPEPPKELVKTKLKNVFSLWGGSIQFPQGQFLCKHSYLYVLQIKTKMYLPNIFNKSILKQVN